jgi:hypothetical protein
VESNITTDKVDKIVDEIYTLYGTDSGFLFTLPPEDRIIVRLIVWVVLKIQETTEGVD